MDDFVSRIKAEIAGPWSRLSRVQQFMIVALGIITVVVVLLFTMWAQTPNYQVAYSNLSESDSGAVITKLQEMKVPYQVSESGKAILVSASKVHEVRFELASQGLPQGGTMGFELFDRTNLGITDFAERLNYRRALEGELTRTINCLAAVEQSRVHLVIPQPELYSDRQKEATASVVLKLRVGRQLDSRQIKGISHLVAGSVEGLKPENLTIVDTNGNILSSELGSEKMFPTAATSNQMELQRSYERDLEQRVQGMLEKALGPNKAVVRVNSVMNWERIEKESETFGPEGKDSSAVRSSHQTEESYSGKGVPGAAGIPGTDSNLKEKTTTTSIDESGTASYSRKDVTNNFETSKTITRLVKSPGTLEKLSVAVILDGPVDEARAASLRQAVSAAVGLDPGRGDAIEVTVMEFDKSFLEEQKEALKQAEQWSSYFEIAKGVALVLPLMLLILVLLFRSRGARLGRKAFVGAPDGVFATITSEALPREAQRKQLVRQKVITLAKNQPEIMARQIRSWLEEE